MSAAAAETMPSTEIRIIMSSPGAIDAGADITLQGEIRCSPARNLEGRELLITDGDGALLGAAAVAETRGETSTTHALALKAPVDIGEYPWRAVLPALIADGVVYEEVAAPFALIVKSHSTSVTVWDVPSAVLAGKTFSVRVGVKCSSECRPSGWTIEVLDHDGACVATATPGDAPWPGTATLYFAEVAVEAPEAEGHYRWRATAPGSDHAVPHEQRAAEFGVTVVAQPEVVLRIEAVDSQSQMPVKGAKVVAHPYRAFTDDQGVAELKVAKGEYIIFVSGRRHIPFRTLGAVMADMTVRASLSADIGLSDADIWS